MNSHREAKETLHPVLFSGATERDNKSASMRGRYARAVRAVRVAQRALKKRTERKSVYASGSR